VGWCGVEWSGVEWSGVGWSGVGKSGVEWKVLKFVRLGSDYSREVLKITKRGSDYRWEVLKFMKLGSQECWVYDNLQKKMIERPGKMIEASLKYCVLRGSFLEKSDSFIQNHRF
jgi:hypothetical protein